jgi:steroid delta-isomerase-like uncharacterized protein
MTDLPVVEAFYAAYNAHDAEAAAGLYTEDGTHDEIAMGQSRSGHDALRDGLNGLFRMLPDVVFHPRKTLKSADHIAVFYEMTGTFTPRPSEQQPSPEPRAIALDGMHLLTLREGAIARTQDYWDKDAFLSQIG